MKERIAMPVIFSASAAFSSSCATALEADLCQISTMSCWKILSTMSSWKIILNVITKLSQRVAKLLHVFSDRPEIPGVDANGKLSTINGTEQQRAQRHKKDLMAESMSLDPISVSKALFRIKRSLSR